MSEAWRLRPVPVSSDLAAFDIETMALALAVATGKGPRRANPLSHELACDHDHQRDDPEKNEINADQRKAVLWLRLHHPMMCSQAECRGNGELKLSKRFKVDVVGVRRAVSMTKRIAEHLMIAHAHQGLANLANMTTAGTPTTDRMSMRLRKSCMVPLFACF
jgi:hypothetical protein